MPLQRTSPDRIDLSGDLPDSELRGLAGDPRVRTLQTSGPLDPAGWRALDQTFFSRRPDVELRVYGFYGIPCDLAFARTLEHVRNFSADCLMAADNVDAIAAIPGLQNLHLQSLRQVRSLPDLRAAKSLRRVWIETLKGLADLSPLESAPALEDVALVGASHLSPEDLLPVLRNPRLRHLRAGLGSKRKNDRVAELVHERGLSDDWEPFQYA